MFLHTPSARGIGLGAHVTWNKGAHENLGGIYSLQPSHCMVFHSLGCCSVFFFFWEGKKKLLSHVYTTRLWMNGSFIQLQYIFFPSLHFQVFNQKARIVDLFWRKALMVVLHSHGHSKKSLSHQFLFFFPFRMKSMDSQKRHIPFDYYSCFIPRSVTCIVVRRYFLIIDAPYLIQAYASALCNLFSSLIFIQYFKRRNFLCPMIHNVHFKFSKVFLYCLLHYNQFMHIVS